jgi:putative hemolysin
MRKANLIQRCWIQSIPPPHYNDMPPPNARLCRHRHNDMPPLNGCSARVSKSIIRAGGVRVKFELAAYFAHYGISSHRLDTDS